jgi:voltage-gated potassium channel
MTLITISTLGMKAGTRPDISHAGEVCIMIMIVIGILSAMIAMTTIVGLVVEGQIRSVLGRRKVNMKIASLTNHTIVCGYGRMGHSLCDHLRLRKVPMVIVDQNDRNTAQAEKDGFLYVLGDASEESVLRDAGIDRAQALVTSLPTDADNVFVTLVARDINKKLFIAARAERVESEARLVQAGADKAICPQVIGATRLANILTRPGVVDFIDFASQGLDIEAEQYQISPESKLVGQSLREANLPRLVGLLVIALKRKDGQTLFNPDPDTVLQIGDVMLVTGQVGSLAKLEEQFS